MTYYGVHGDVNDETGYRQMPVFMLNDGGWGGLWQELLKTNAIQGPLSSCSTFTSSMSIESLPMLGSAADESTAKMVEEFRSFFSANVKDTAQILGVSRQMFYHYKEGMEPDPENRRRFSLLSSIVQEWSGVTQHLPASYLKTPQPEGRTLLDFLSEKNINRMAVRAVIGRAVSQDQLIRENLASNIIAGESSAQRLDVVRELHATGKPVFVADNEHPGKIIQLYPDGRRVRGTMIRRKFVPDHDAE